MEVSQTAQDHHHHFHHDSGDDDVASRSSSPSNTSSSAQGPPLDQEAVPQGVLIFTSQEDDDEGSFSHQSTTIKTNDTREELFTGHESTLLFSSAENEEEEAENEEEEEDDDESGDIPSLPPVPIVQGSSAGSQPSDSTSPKTTAAAISEVNPLKPKSPDWDADELDTLIEAVRKYGTNWRKVLEDPEFKARFKPERTSLSLKTKWFRAKGTPIVVQKLGLPKRKNQDLAQIDQQVSQRVSSGEDVTVVKSKRNVQKNARTRVHAKVDFKSPVVTFKQIQQLYCQNPPSVSEQLQNRKRKAEECIGDESKTTVVGEEFTHDDAQSQSTLATMETEAIDDLSCSSTTTTKQEQPAYKRRKVTKSSTRNTKNSYKSKIYRVERIVSHRFVPDEFGENDEVLEFLLRWKGFDESQDSWEPLRNVSQEALRSLLPRYYSDGEGMSLSEICRIAGHVNKSTK